MARIYTPPIYRFYKALKGELRTNLGEAQGKPYNSESYVFIIH